MFKPPKRLLKGIYVDRANDLTLPGEIDYDYESASSRIMVKTVPYLISAPNCSASAD